MKVSIIVPVYQVERYLRACIESVLCQTHREWELILGEDGSPDRCVVIVTNMQRMMPGSP